jgi:hypothetical protein
MAEEWLKENVVPVLARKYDKSDYLKVLELTAPEYDDTLRKLIMLELGVEISDEHLHRAMWMYLNDRKTKGR